MRYLKLFALVAVAVASTGCLRLTYSLNLKPDGSGTISTTFAVAETMMAQAGAMLGAGGSMFPTEEQMRESAKGMGGGVRFVSTTPYKTGGFEGVTALYAFDDLNKLTLNMEQAISGSVNAPSMIDGQLDPGADLKFSFTREGDRTVLVLGMPQVPEPDEQVKQQAETAAAAAATQDPAVDAMMKQLMGGMLMEVAINIEGKILKTNAPFVEGSRVVLLRLDGDELIKAGQGLGPLAQLGTGGNVQQMLSKVPGLKVVTQPEVRIEFSK